MGSEDADTWKECVQRIVVSGDAEAFARLFDHFMPRIEAFLLRLGQDAAGAEDIAQEVMTTLWRKAHLYDSAQASVSTWLYRIARNRHIDSRRRRVPDAIDPQSPGLLDLVDPSAAMDDQFSADQDASRIRMAIARLPEAQQALIRLAFYDGLSHADIAASTGQPLGTVKSRIRLAFSKLRRDIETSGG